MRKRSGFDNHGFTLIELIVVIAVMSVVGLSVFFGMSLISGKSAKEMSKTVESLAQKNRTYCMGKRQASVEFTYDSGSGWSSKEIFGLSKTDSSDIDTREVVTNGIGDTDVEVFVVDLNSGAESSLSSFSFEFNRSDGSLRNFNGLPATGNVVLNFKSGNKTYQLKIERMTGKINVTQL